MSSSRSSDPMSTPDYGARARMASQSSGPLPSTSAPVLDLSALAAELESAGSSAFSGAESGIPASVLGSEDPSLPHPYMVIPDVSDYETNDDGSLKEGEADRVFGLIYLPDGCFVYGGEKLSFDGDYVKSVSSRYDYGAPMANAWYSFTTKAIDVGSLQTSASAASPLYAHVLKKSDGTVKPVRLTTKEDPRTDSEKSQADSTTHLELVAKVQICKVYAEVDFGNKHRYVVPANPCVESAVIMSSGDGDDVKVDDLSVAFKDIRDPGVSETDPDPAFSRRLEIKGWNKDKDGANRESAVKASIPTGSESSETEQYTKYEFVARDPNNSVTDKLVYVRLKAPGGSGGTGGSGTGTSCSCSHEGNTGGTGSNASSSISGELHFESAYKGDGSDGKDNVEVRTWDDNGVKKITIGVYYV